MSDGRLPIIVAYNRTYSELKVLLPGNTKVYTYYGVVPDIRDRLEKHLKRKQLGRFYACLKSFSDRRLHNALHEGNRKGKEHN